MYLAQIASLIHAKQKKNAFIAEGVSLCCSIELLQPNSEFLVVFVFVVINTENN